MKKLLLSVFFFIAAGAFATHAQAQTSPKLGIRGGFNIANLNNVDGTDSRTGLMVGIFTDFAVPNSPVYIQPEVLYTQKGYKSGNATVKLNYIQIPVLAKFDFVTNGSVTPNVYFGPYVGFNVKATVDGSNTVADQLSNDDIKDQVKNTDFGIVVGGGLDFGKVELGVRYGAGLTDTFENGDGKNGVFSIVAGIGF